MGGPSTTSTAARGGFTLFELVLVLLLMAIAATLVAPRALPLSGRRLDAAVVQAHALARHARNNAVTKGTAVRLRFDAFERRFWIETETDPVLQPGVFEPPGDEWGQGVLLPEGVEIEQADPETVDFEPDGRADECLVVFSAAGDERVGLFIRAATGLSRVVDGEELEYRQRQRADRSRDED